MKSDKNYRVADGLIGAILGSCIGGGFTVVGYLEDFGLPISTPLFFRGELAVAGAMLFGVAGYLYGKQFTDGVDDLIEIVRDYFRRFPD